MGVWWRSLPVNLHVSNSNTSNTLSGSDILLTPTSADSQPPLSLLYFLYCAPSDIPKLNTSPYKQYVATETDNSIHQLCGLWLDNNITSKTVKTFLWTEISSHTYTQCRLHIVSPASTVILTVTVWDPAFLNSRLAVTFSFLTASICSSLQKEFGHQHNTLNYRSHGNLVHYCLLWPEYTSNGLFYWNNTLNQQKGNCTAITNYLFPCLCSTVTQVIVKTLQQHFFSWVAWKDNQCPNSFLAKNENSWTVPREKLCTMQRLVSILLVIKNKTQLKHCITTPLKAASPTIVK